jgi:two-component sensor histidine kinase
MAQVYGHLLPQQESRVVDMRYFLTDLVEKLFQSLTPSGPVAFQISCDDVELPHHQALAIGIVTNELVTNCLKYAFPGDRSGNILVALRVGDRLELSVSDNGVGFNDAARTTGQGSRIIELLTQQLEGTIQYERLDPGHRVELKAPFR